jgi:hypothetical protein
MDDIELFSDTSDGVKPTKHTRMISDSEDDLVDQGRSRSSSQSRMRSEFEYAELNPELYGLRRSGRSSKSSGQKVSHCVEYPLRAKLHSSEQSNSFSLMISRASMDQRMIMMNPRRNQKLLVNKLIVSDCLASFDRTG